MATRAAIDAEIAKMPEKRGALLAALRLVQAEYGYLPPEVMEEVAQIFGLHPTEVFEVVSFYNHFHVQPRGRHEVNVCTSLTCSLRGGRGLLRQLQAYLGVRAGQTTEDGRISLGHEECLGACGNAPMLRIDDTYHLDLDWVRTQQLLDGLE
ncbi:MAG: NAD(P)H-dependent oxidoreductase subunit E [Deltaproteobacteria bacterium]|nr:NAD(P)H-dependent oxidoreductase subunit E [Deltaproteobacteria bacterium]MBW2395222.1 NAD(P)H-dependent oxidoreductase subunit E [Deltaproteobacteria bacterium]